MDNTQNYLDDFMKIVNVAASAEDSEGRSFYTPGYGGYGASELRSNMYQNFFSNFSNYAIQREVNEKNLELAEKENQWNVDMWNLNNKYNEPSQQVQRFKDAGMSSAGAVQASQGFASQPVQSANLANQQIGNPMTGAQYGNPLSGIMSVLQMAGTLLNFNRDMQQYRVDKVAADKAEATMQSDISGILTTNDAKRWALQQSIQDFEFNSRSFPYRLKATEYAAQKAGKDVQYQDYANQLVQQNVKLAEQQFGFLERYNEKQIDEMQSLIDKNIAETKLAEQKKSESVASENASNAQAGYYGAMQGNVEKDTEHKEELITGEKRKNYALSVENALKTFGYPEDFTGKMAALVEGGIISPNDVGSFLKHDKEFIKTSGDMFNGNDAERNALDYFLTPGNSKSNNVPLWSHGTYNVTKGRVKGAAKNIWNKLLHPNTQGSPFE